MQETGTSNHVYKKLFLVVILTCVTILMISYYDSAKILNYQVFSTSSSVINDSLIKDGTKYLVFNLKCRIVDSEPFSRDAKKYFKYQKYKSCSTHGLLTYVTKVNNVAVVHIDKELSSDYTKKKIKCCYSNVTRHTPANGPDNSIKLSGCLDFDQNVTLFTEAIFIKCTEATNVAKQIYENVHTAIRITENVQQKIQKWNTFYNTSENSSATKENTNISTSNNIYDTHENKIDPKNETRKPISVLFVGIDSISRLNFFRTMPKTYEYVSNNGWLTLEGYNKMDDNTFPNLMAIFTGFNQSHAYQVCQPKTIAGMDKCPLLWYTFRDLGYVTGYAEDEAFISTFNYNKKGFKELPVDYYFRPYILASEKLAKVDLNGIRYCTGPETSGERILNLLREFAVTFKETPNFGIFWMNSFSHNELNAPQTMDNKVKSLLQDLENNGVYDNSLVIFLSDHGMRFGDIRLTETGWLEERLPFIYFSFPQWFKRKFPVQYQNFVNNRNRLTTPYDLFMTLQHILVLSDLNYTKRSSDACPNCQSLFDQVPFERSCEDAAIEDHWCTCAGYKEIKLESSIKEKVSYVLENEFNSIIKNHEEGKKCAKLKIAEFISTRLSQKFSYKDTIYLLVIVKTEPKSMFETTLTIHGDINLGNYTIGPISRLDIYKSNAKCVDDAYLKKYCYCIN